MFFGSGRVGGQLSVANVLDPSLPHAPLETVAVIITGSVVIWTFAVISRKGLPSADRRFLSRFMLLAWAVVPIMGYMVLSSRTPRERPEIQQNQPALRKLPYQKTDPEPDYDERHDGGREDDSGKSLVHLLRLQR